MRISSGGQSNKVTSRNSVSNIGSSLTVPSVQAGHRAAAPPGLHRLRRHLRRKSSQNINRDIFTYFIDIFIFFTLHEARLNLSLMKAWSYIFTPHTSSWCGVYYLSMETSPLHLFTSSTNEPSDSMRAVSETRTVIKIPFLPQIQ
jgi:hypothetical protein